MKRPDLRPMRALPMLEARRSTLEKCVFCPKLCRSACPVSNAEPRETVTPWGKMSMAYFAAHGDVPMDASHAAPAWACTGCYGCRESCDHKNDVASTLYEARAGLAAAGVAPEGAKRTIARFAAHDEATRQAARELFAHPAVRSDAPDTVLVGCAYLRGAMPEARHAIDAASALVRGPVALAEACCGYPLLLAGAGGGFRRQAERFARETKRAKTILVADAGCAMALRVRYAEVGVELAAKVELIVERAARSLGDLSVVDDGKSGADGAVRYHDPCQLGRGLGVYDAPRAVLTRALGRAPDEFDERRERAACSGAGGLLPATMPDTARTIADARLDEHQRLCDGRDGRGARGGRVVTACGSSLLAFRRRGRAPVDDLVTWIARAARPWRAV
jgi:Fe-S oxidoreductase